MKEPRLLNRTNLAPQRGKQALERFRDMIKDARAKGREPTSLTVSRRIADYLRAHYASIAQTDNKLPPLILGVPLLIDLGANDDFVLRTEGKKKVEAVSPIYVGRA